jgi:hypothetical protein
LKKVITLIFLTFVILVGCNNEEEKVRKELEELGMNKEEQDATLEEVGLEKNEEENVEKEKGVATYSVLESMVPFGGEPYSEIKGTKDADVYYEGDKTLVSFKVDDKQRYFVSVMENGKWVQKDQAYVPFKLEEYHSTMSKNYIIDVKMRRNVDSGEISIGNMKLYDDKFMKESPKLHEYSDLNDISVYKFINSNKGKVLVLGNFEKYILPKEDGLYNFNLIQENFNRGAYDSCDSSTIDFDGNFLFCSSFGASESRIARFDLNTNEWMYTEDGAEIKEVVVDEDGKIIVNTEGEIGSVASYDPYGEIDYLTFQAFDSQLNPIGEKLQLDIPIAKDSYIQTNDFTIETEGNNFVVWYQYSYKGKPAIAKYVIGDPNEGNSKKKEKAKESVEKDSEENENPFKQGINKEDSLKLVDTFRKVGELQQDIFSIVWDQYDSPKNAPTFEEFRPYFADYVTDSFMEQHIIPVYNKKDAVAWDNAYLFFNAVLRTDKKLNKTETDTTLILETVTEETAGDTAPGGDATLTFLKENGKWLLDEFELN